MRRGLGTANRHPNTKRPGQDLMSEIGSRPVRKVLIGFILAYPLSGSSSASDVIL